jgi:hypothetical protein
MRDDGHRRRLVVPGLPLHTLRGYATENGEITVTVGWGTSDTPTGKRNVMCFTATEWPGGALISRVVRPWRGGGDWHAWWNETRRQVRDITGTDVGDPPHVKHGARGRSGRRETGLFAKKSVGAWSRWVALATGSSERAQIQTAGTRRLCADVDHS